MKFLAALIIPLIMAAGSVDQPLDDPQAEARAQALMREIRCVACENEPISQSASEIARDMRKVVRDQIAEGQSDAEVRDWFAQRYGDFVLFRPKTDGGGVFLWMFPFALLIYAAVMLFLMMRSRARTARSGLSPIDADEEN
ncbi:MAG: cytochrome C biogenesis protein [Hirschia sp.]|nr:cytochrome C biogenesis protein [Hirschia sp.]MBF19315.1 cytochrome C biogenesis protein [Hirschia sp.]|tara:strand:- start:401 stop:823 length:423 start_codon:yes stop_codon:yes gene_type:complete